jgi:sec-independent protein translocase protein TatA
MPNIGPMELAVVLLIALLVLGPKRLPAAGRSLGQGLREFKESIAGKEQSGGTSGSAGRRGRGREEQARETGAIARPSVPCEPTFGDEYPRAGWS